MRLQKRLTPFVDLLPIPVSLRPVSRNGKFTFYIVRMLERLQKLHRDLPLPESGDMKGDIPVPPLKQKETNRFGCFG